VEEYGRDFQESINRLLEKKGLSAKQILILLVIMIILDIFLIFTRTPLDYIDSFVLILSNNVIFLVIIFEKLIIKRDVNSQFEKIMLNINLIIERLTELKIFHSNSEKRVFEKNFESLHIFKLTQNYKYCMIAMGSMIEFLLVRYCKDHSITPAPIIRDGGKTQSGSNFSNYIQAAINNDLFGQRKSWIIVQNSLRSFRNYVHISKEIREEEIDSSWYLAIVPIFTKLLLNVGKNN